MAIAMQGLKLKPNYEGLSFKPCIAIAIIVDVIYKRKINYFFNLFNILCNSLCFAIIW